MESELHPEKVKKGGSPPMGPGESRTPIASPSKEQDPEDEIDDARQGDNAKAAESAKESERARHRRPLS